MKRILAAALCLMLLGAGAFAETFTVAYFADYEGESYDLLIRDDGTLLTPPQTYHSIYEITPRGTPEAERMYEASYLNPDIDPTAYDPDGEDFYRRVGLMNAAGEMLTGDEFIHFEWADGHILFTTQDNAVGVMDLSGQVTIPARYIEIVPISTGGFIAQKLDGPVDYDAYYPLVRIDPDGSEHELQWHAGWSGLYTWSQGILCLDEVEEFDGRSIYMDESGSMLFGRVFGEIHAFLGNYAVAAEGEMDGLIDKNGKFVVPAEYDYISDEADNTEPCFIARKGGTVTLFSAEDAHVMMSVTLEGRDTIGAYFELPGLLHVTSEEDEYLYTTDGTLLRKLEPGTDVTINFPVMEGVPDVLLESSGQGPESCTRLTDLDGNPIGKDYWSIYGSIWQGGHGLFQTCTTRTYTDVAGDKNVDWRSWRYGLCDEAGNEVLPNVYDNLQVLSMDRFWVTRGSRVGMIDRDGHWYYEIDGYTSLMD